MGWASRPAFFGGFAGDARQSASPVAFMGPAAELGQTIVFCGLPAQQRNAGSKTVSNIGESLTESFRPYGAGGIPDRYPRAYALGYYLAPLRGWAEEGPRENRLDLPVFFMKFRGTPGPLEQTTKNDRPRRPTFPPAPRPSRRSRTSARRFPGPSRSISPKNASPSALAMSRRALTRAGSWAASILAATTTIGLCANSSLKLASSRITISKSCTGSRPVASDTSTKCASRRVRSMCRKNWMPSPWPRCAPSMRPGMSATTKLRKLSSCATPRLGSKRGERVIGDLRPRRRDARNQRGFAGVRKPHQPYVGQQLQLQPQALLLAGVARLVLGGRLVGGGGEARVALASAAAARHHEPLAGLGEIVQALAGGFVVDHRAHRHVELRSSRPSAPVRLLPSPWRPRSALCSGLKRNLSSVFSCVVGHQDDVAAAPAIAAAGTAPRNVLLPPEGQTAVAAVAGLHQDC